MNLIQLAKQYANGIRTLTEWLGSGGHTVDPERAQTRANICLNCPKNVLVSNVTLMVAEAIRDQLELKDNLDLHLKGEHGLGECMACGCVMKLKVWVPIERIRPTDDERKKLHELCWLTKEA